MLIRKPGRMNGAIAFEIRRQLAFYHVRVNNDESLAEKRNQGLSKCTLTNSVRSSDDEYEWCLHKLFVHFPPKT